MLEKINHIGVVVRSLADAIPLYRDILGLAFEGVEEVAGYQVRVAFFRIGESRIELLEPTASSGMVAEFLKRSGPGIHHVAYEVEDVEAASERCESRGLRMIDRSPRPGAHGARVAFIDPASCQSVVIELCQSEHERGTS
jgi:methylmalonyl-CoA/ethylmalonyl-CoA epimerase